MEISFLPEDSNWQFDRWIVQSAPTRSIAVKNNYGCKLLNEHLASWKTISAR